MEIILILVPQSHSDTSHRNLWINLWASQQPLTPDQWPHAVLPAGLLAPPINSFPRSHLGLTLSLNFSLTVIIGDCWKSSNTNRQRYSPRFHIFVPQELPLGKVDSFQVMVPDWFIFPSFTSLFSEPIQALGSETSCDKAVHSSINCGEEGLLFALNLHLSSSLWGPISTAVRRMASNWPQLSLDLTDSITYSLIQLFYDLLLCKSFHISDQLLHFSGPSSLTNLLLKRYRDESCRHSRCG